MSDSEYISLLYNNNIYIIMKEPFETNKETYNRGWFIVKNYNNYTYDKLYSLSIINNNIDNNMYYEKL
jgi:hypothetical protein